MCLHDELAIYLTEIKGYPPDAAEQEIYNCMQELYEDMDALYCGATDDERRLLLAAIA